jgi:hypothetical protein
MGCSRRRLSTAVFYGVRVRCSRISGSFDGRKKKKKEYSCVVTII